jgi:hypothetical protein
MIRSLFEVFSELPDFRDRKGRRHEMTQVLTVVTLGLLSGQNNPRTIAQWGQGLDRDKRRRLKLWRNKVPSESTIRRVLRGLDDGHRYGPLRVAQAPGFLGGGVAPGNNESAGKRRSGKTPLGNRYLRQALVRGAHGAKRTKGSYLKAKYHRLAARRGKKRAIVAVGHSILVSAYHMLSRQEAYRDLGDTYLDEHKREYVVNRLVRRIEKLGYQVELEARSEVLPTAV